MYKFFWFMSRNLNYRYPKKKYFEAKLQSSLKQKIKKASFLKKFQHKLTFREILVYFFTRKDFCQVEYKKLRGICMRICFA